MKESAAVLTLTLLISSIAIQGCLCEEMDVIRSIRDAYSELVRAEERGADVRDAALKLQRALELVREAEEDPENREALLSEARCLVEQVESSIPILIEEGEKRIFWRNVTIASIIASIAILSFLTYYYGPRVFWSLWLRIRSRWMIEIIGRDVRRRDRRGG